jgi:hypothetical protein
MLVNTTSTRYHIPEDCFLQHFSWQLQRQLSNFVKEIKLVFCENHEKSTNKHELNADVLCKIKAGDTYNNYMAISGKFPRNERDYYVCCGME